MRIVWIAFVVLLSALPLQAEEFRLKDGEVIFGKAVAGKKGRIEIETGHGVRKIAESDIVERLEGMAPHVEFDQSERDASLLDMAWHHKLDERARTLAAELGDNELARGILARGDERSPAWGVTGRTGPRWGAKRRSALSSLGGNSSTEKLVTAALDWLVAHQDDDGRLDADQFMKHDPEDDKCDGAGGGHHGGKVACPYDGVTTAVALMAWLASGSTPVSGPYAEAVAKALRFCVGVLKGGSRGFDAIWSYAFCTQAVADAYTVTRDPELRPVLRTAVLRLLGGQLQDGGWRYFGGVGGVPTTCAVAMALGQAIQAGIPVPDKAVKKIIAFLDARIDAKTGRSEYHDGAERLGYTPTTANAASALAVRALLGNHETTPKKSKQVSVIGAKKPVWSLKFKKVKTKDGRVVNAQIGNLYPYAWYYTTIALHQNGGGAWSKWFGALKGALKKGQRKDGSAAGSWDPIGTYSNSAGRVFITGICALMLQSPYRFPRK